MDILKSAGYKISALEIEEVIREHPSVREVAVVGVPDLEWGEIVTACVIPQTGQSVTLDQLRGWCGDKLAPYKVPRRLELTADLPRNAMGKVTKPELIRQLNEQHVSSIDMVTSTFLTIAQLRGKKAGAVLAVSDECLYGKFAFRDPLFFAAEQKTIEVARKALQYL